MPAKIKTHWMTDGKRWVRVPVTPTYHDEWVEAFHPVPVAHLGTLDKISFAPGTVTHADSLHGWLRADGKIYKEPYSFQSNELVERGV